MENKLMVKYKEEREDKVGVCEVNLIHVINIHTTDRQKDLI